MTDPKPYTDARLVRIEAAYAADRERHLATIRQGRSHAPRPPTTTPRRP